MIAIESPDQNGARSGREGQKGEKSARRAFDDDKERYGLRVSYIEDNSVHIRDALGNEVAFEFPLGNVSLVEYDTFVERMQNDNLPLPPIEDVKMSINKPLAHISSGVRAIDVRNSATHPRTWKQHAEDHGIGVDEMRSMYFIAREKRYARFRSRLRN